MSLILPERRPPAPPQFQQAPVPIGQIVNVLGQNPYAYGIEQLGKTLGDAFERKRQLHEQAVQMAAMSKAVGADLTGLTPDEAKTVVPQIMKQRNDQAALMDKRAAKGADDRTQKAYQDRQDRLEKNYHDAFMKILSNRSGGLGLQDLKVDQAVHLRTLANQYYDPQSGSFKIPPTQYNELTLGLANLVSGSSQAGIELMKDLKQKTGHEDLASLMTYITGQPVAGPPEAVAKMFVDSVDRQGLTSEKLRNQYLSGVQRGVPSGLENEAARHVETMELGSNYSDFLSSSPDKVGLTPMPGQPQGQQAPSAISPLPGGQQKIGRFSVTVE